MFGTSIPPLGNEDLQREMKAAEIKMKAKEAMFDAVFDLMLCDAPEDCKAEIEIMKQHSELEKSARAIIRKFAIDTPTEKTPELIEAQKAVRDYLKDVTDGLKQYFDEAVKLLEQKQ